MITSLSAVAVPVAMATAVLGILGGIVTIMDTNAMDDELTWDGCLIDYRITYPLHYLLRRDLES